MRIVLSLVFVFYCLTISAQCVDCEICEGETPPLICAYGLSNADTPPGVDIAWDNGETTNCFTPADTDAGNYTYTVTISDPNGICDPLEGCVDFLINPIRDHECRSKVVNDPADFNSIPYDIGNCDIIACEGQSVALRVDFVGAGATANDNCVVTLPGGATQTASALGQIIVTDVTAADAGTYVFTCTLGTGCEVVVEMTLVVNPLPVIDCSNVVDTCDGDNGSVIATSSESGGTWTIAPIAGTNAGNGTFTDLPAGDYIITHTTDAGCESTCEFTIEGSNLPELDLKCIPQN